MWSTKSTHPHGKEVFQVKNSTRSRCPRQRRTGSKLSRIMNAHFECVLNRNTAGPFQHRQPYHTPKHQSNSRRSPVRHLCLVCRHLGYKGVDETWAEYVAVDAANAYRIPEGLSFTIASLAEPTAVCYQSFQRARLCNDSSILIIGDRPFGFLHAIIARALGAQSILLAGHHDQRLRRIAENTYAETCNTHRESLEQALAKVTRGPGADIVIEATGSGAAASMGLQALRPRGTMVIFSYVWKPQVLDLAAIHMKELNVIGACRSLECFEPSLDLIREGKIEPGALLDKEFSLNEPEKAMFFLQKHKSNTFKVIFTRV